jgi:hypothetical protein
MTFTFHLLLLFLILYLARLCLPAHLEWWRAYSHFVRPHASLRMALVHPRERGGKLLAQRYRQCTPAMAAGRTNRRWTALEVLCYPLSPMPQFTL